MEKIWKHNIVYKYKIKVLTGLHIGGSNEELKIGGTDNAVISTRCVINGKPFDLPYIPGSSIKGKIGTLVEAVYPENKNVEILFGHKKNTEEDIKTRLIIRDFTLNDDEINKYLNDDLQLTEIKGENVIKPLSSKAIPRFIERVLPGVEFYGEFIISIFNDDNEDEFKKIIKNGIELLEDSYLGGNGTRGYGKIKFELTTSEEIKDKSKYEGS